MIYDGMITEYEHTTTEARVASRTDGVMGIARRADQDGEGECGGWRMGVRDWSVRTRESILRLYDTARGTARACNFNEMQMYLMHDILSHPGSSLLSSRLAPDRLRQREVGIHRLKPVRPPLVALLFDRKGGRPAGVSIIHDLSDPTPVKRQGPELQFPAKSPTPCHTTANAHPHPLPAPVPLSLFARRLTGSLGVV